MTKKARIINDDFKIKVGGRKAPKISLDEFQEIFKDQMIMAGYDEGDMDCGECLDFIAEQINEPGTTFNKDCKYEIEFDNPDLADFDVLPNGLPVFEFSVGGDEGAGYVYGVVYWDGKKLRLFQPTYGNLVNRDTMAAINGIDDEYYFEKYGYDYATAPDFDHDACVEETMARIEVDGVATPPKSKPATSTKVAASPKSKSWIDLEKEKIKKLRATASKEEQLAWLMANAFPQDENHYIASIDTRTMQPVIATELDDIYNKINPCPKEWKIYEEMLRDCYTPYCFDIETDEPVVWSSTIITAIKERKYKDCIPATMTFICGDVIRVEKVYLVDRWL